MWSIDPTRVLHDDMAKLPHADVWSNDATRSVVRWPVLDSRGRGRRPQSRSASGRSMLVVVSVYRDTRVAAIGPANIRRSRSLGQAGLVQQPRRDRPDPGRRSLHA